MKLLMILQVLDALVSDVVTVLHAHPVDAGNALVGFFLGFFQRRGNGDNIQHAAAIDDEFAVLLSSACMERRLCCRCRPGVRRLSCFPYIRRNHQRH